MMGDTLDVKIVQKGLKVIVPRNAGKDTSNVLARAQYYINGLKQLNETIVEDIATRNRAILDRGKEQIKKLKKMNEQ